MKNPIRNFRSFTSWQNTAKRMQLKTVRVSKSKSNEYWQARRPDGLMVGFFNTVSASGMLDMEHANTAKAHRRAIARNAKKFLR